MGIIEDSGQFIPTTNIWDIQDLYSMDVNSKQFKELLVRLYQNVANITQVINSKDVGIYDQREFVCGQLYFPNTNPIAGQPNEYRQVYRKVINFGALPAAGAAINVAHGIAVTPGFMLTRLYGASKDPVANEFISLPYVSGAAPTTSVGLYMTAVNIIARSSPAKAWDMFTQTYIVIEYLKQ